MEGMELKITLNLKPGLQHRLKTAAKLKGVPIEEYCYAAIDKELARDEENGLKPKSQVSDAERFRALHKKYFPNGKLSSDSVDDIREAREERTRQLEGLL